MLGQGTSPENSGWVEEMNRRVGGQEFEWNRGGPVPCFLDREKDCPSQRLTLYIANDSAQIELWDYEYVAKSQGITKPDPNRPRPKVDKTFVLFGLKGGDSEDEVETTLRDGGYSSPDCKIDSASQENKCDTTRGNYRFSFTFFHGRLESFNFQFPKSDWERQVLFFSSNLGEPYDSDKRTNAEAISWQSVQSTPCATSNEEGKQCPAESLILSTGSEAAIAGALYLYGPLVNELIVEQAQRMMGGRFPNAPDNQPDPSTPTTGGDAVSSISAQTSTVPYAEFYGPLFKLERSSDAYPQLYESIHDVDFQNLTVRLGNGGTFHLRNGKYETKDEVGQTSVEIAGVHYPSSSEKGREYALVLYEEDDVGGSSNQEGVAKVFELEDKRLRDVQSLSWDLHHGGPHGKLDTFNEKENSLEIASSHYRPGDAHCCVSAVDIIVYHWEGKRLNQASVRTELLTNDSGSQQR